MAGEPGSFANDPKTDACVRMPIRGMDDMTRSDRRTLMAALVLVAGSGLAPGCHSKEQPRDAQASPAAATAPAEPAGPPLPEVQAVVQGDPGQRPPPRAHLAGCDRRPAGPEGPVRGRARRPLLVRRGLAAPGPEWSAGCDRAGGCPGARADGLRRPGPRQQVGSRARGRRGHSRRPRALRRRAHVSAMRLLQSAHWGRVDPRLVGFDYDVSAKRLDLAAVLRSTRDAGGLPAAVAAVEPQFPVYRRLVKALADYRALAAAGEPEPVPALAGKQKKVEPGKPWAGVAALAARLRTFGDLPADAPAPGGGRRRNPPLRRCARGRREALPGPPHPRARRSDRPRHDRGAQRARGRPRAPDRAGPRARALAARVAA